MRLIVEQIVDITALAPRLKKVRLVELDVDMPPVGPGDDLWFINAEDNKRRTRLVAFDMRTAIDDYNVYMIIDAVTPELRTKMLKMGLDVPAYRKLIGDSEEPAPDAVEIPHEGAA